MLKSRFPQIIAQLNPRVGGAVKLGAELIERRAKERVPVDEGDLREAIHTERAGVLSQRVMAGNDEVFYGHLVENGTVHSAPRPFLIPTVEASKVEVLGLVTASLRKL